jgi:hypothetical protein
MRMDLDLATARHFYACSGRSVVPAPVLARIDGGDLPDVVLTDGPPATFVFPLSLLLSRSGLLVEHVDGEEHEEFLDRMRHDAGVTS